MKKKVKVKKVKRVTFGSRRPGEAFRRSKNGPIYLKDDLGSGQIVIGKNLGRVHGYLDEDQKVYPAKVKIVEEKCRGEVTENYFYTDKAQENKIYVFWNYPWLNQLIRIGDLYYWVSLNECGMNWDIDGEATQNIQKAIENVMCEGFDVYQLDTLEELAEFIESWEG